MRLDDIFRGAPTPAKWAELGRYLRANQVTAGAGMRMRRSSSGTVLTSSPSARAIPGGEGEHPFQIINASSDGQARVRVALGTVNGAIPKIGGGFIHVRTGSPAVFPYLVVTGNGIVVLKVEMGGPFLISSAEIIFGTTEEAPDDEIEPDGTGDAHIIIGAVNLVEGAVQIQSPQPVQTSLQVATCHDGAIWGRV